MNQEKINLRELSLCTDWINSKPVFYNEKTREVSRNMLDVVDWGNFSFDPEGLYNYLFFGYQVFEQTPIKNIKMLRFSSRLIRSLDDEGKESIQIIEDPDPIDAFSGRTSSAEEAIANLQNHICAFECGLKKDDTRRFLLPLSGGFDSRFLAAMIADKSRIDAFTFDISLSGNFSFELLKAKAICKLLGINWQQVYPNNFWGKNYLHQNFRIFSLEMPIHASYHMEMYDIITQNFGHNYIALSGSVGDWWRTHKTHFDIPKDHLNFDALFFNHGISIPREFIKVQTNHEIKREKFESNIRRIKEDEIFRIVFARRGRMGLASYIFRTAEIYFDTYTPFYDIDIAMSQLCLPHSQKNGQKWVHNYFRKNGLLIEDPGNTNIIMSYDCSLDLQASHSLSITDYLHESILGEFVDEKRISWINQELSRMKKIPYHQLRQISQCLFSLDRSLGSIINRSWFGRGFDLFFLKFFRSPDLLKAISEWSVLKPIEIILKIARRNGDMSWLVSNSRNRNNV